ncbi:MAG: elongation factor P maturation arginine rhamnosyltransferase EarP [Rhodocyclaceae bacterium]|nr:MAG: elongation factor P maturation arginine rhamnosyltransferase EarP [Rhodocyclaceae bacterium]
MSESDCIVCGRIVEEILPRRRKTLCAQSVRPSTPDLSPVLSKRSPSSTPAAPTEGIWDVFCPVVDNFGDIGVCWRLSRQLVAEYPIAVRLWVDDLKVARRLIPQLDVLAASQQIDGVEIRHWSAPLPDIEPGAVVISAFAGNLPDAFLQAMARRTPKPVWINLEYLSAEDWVGDCHGLPSPHPQLPLTQFFFFPGLGGNSGGFIREADYSARRTAFVSAAFLAALDLPERRQNELRVSLFSYENKGLREIIKAWSAGDSPITCLVPEGRILPELAAEFGVSGLRAGDQLLCGQLVVRILPFVEQRKYDELLWACDLNFVRGEDSFVRAQWAEIPFVWQIYVQKEDAHLEKLRAFLARYQEGLDPELAGALSDFWLAWNRGEGVAAAWPAFRAALPALKTHAKAWSAHLQEGGDLAARLVKFCKLKLE